VLEEQSRALYAKGGIALVANLVNSLILVVALWNAVSHRRALVWLLAMYAMVALRFVLLHRHNTARDRPYRARLWAGLWTGTTAVTGATWGAAGAWLYPEGGAEPYSISARRVGGRARIVIHDAGPGIAPEHLQRIFDVFQRGPSGGAQGLGLGLFIAERIARAHGGSICADSPRGQGTSFVVELPLAD
jgi:hypothetical protein